MITDEQAAVRVRHLSVLRGDYLALDSISFDLLPGTHTAIIGPNGAGKSTLIKAILGLIPKTSGQVLIFGCTSKKLNKLRQGIGYIPQKFPFHGSFPLTVAEFVGLAVPKQGWLLCSSRAKRRAVQQALERVNLRHLAKQKIGTLSGGEFKRVLLAYCLVTPRRLLVLDEALAGVDQTGEAEFAALLALLKEELGWTILEVSHDLDSVKRCCDNVFCLNRKLLAEGCPHVTLTQKNLQQVYGGTHEPTRLVESF